MAMSTPTPPRRKPHILLILLDGCRPDALLAAEAPRLRALLRNRAGRCAFSLHCKTDPTPLSAPSWATLLTGLKVEQHRITSNDLDTLLTIDAQGRLLVQPSDCVCSPVRSASCFASSFSQAKRRKVANSEALPFPRTLFHFLGQHGRTAQLLNVGWPGVPQLCADAALSHCLKVQRFADEAEELDKAVGDMLQLLATEEAEIPDVLALYTHSVDLAGHLHGFSLDVPQYIESIEHFDGCLGSLLDAIAKRESEDWLLAITTDHGGGAVKDMSKALWSTFLQDCKCIHKGLSQASCQGVHGLQDSDVHNTRFLILSGLNVRPGEITPPPEAIDFIPTLLRHLGLPCDDLPGHSRGLRRDA